MDTILILTTGGTIDKVYFDAKSAYEVGPPNISTLLAELNLSISYRIVPVLRKDSLDLTDAVKDRLLEWTPPDRHHGRDRDQSSVDNRQNHCSHRGSAARTIQDQRRTL